MGILYNLRKKEGWEIGNPIFHNLLFNFLILINFYPLSFAFEPLIEDGGPSSLLPPNPPLPPEFDWIIR